MRNILNLIISLLISFALPTIAQARYSTYEEAPIEIEFFNSEIEVQKDGKYTNTIETQTLILNEIGRENYGSQTLIFTKDISDIEIVEAKTILNEVEYKLDPKTIEIKPLASSEKGFDQKYQLLISFPKVVIGSKLYLKYKEIVSTPLIDNHFSTSLSFGLNEYIKNSKIKLISYMPFDYLVNDPYKNLEVQFVQDKTRKILSITQKKPIFYQLSNETNLSMLDNRQMSRVDISTYKNFEDLGKLLAPNYEKIIHEKLPDAFLEIANEAANIEKEKDQIEYIISQLNNKIRYMGSWNTVQGKIYPRNLEEIVSSGFGDCKDFSVSTAAILKHLGYKVNSSLVFRGYNYVENNKALPTISLFNHAIVKATGKSTKLYWLDPTNFVSMASGIFPDINNRKTLILDSKEASYENIPAIDSKHSISSTDKIITLNSNLIKQSFNIKLSGEKAINITGAGLTTSKTALEEEIATYFGGEAKPISKEISLPDLKSRIVQDVMFNFTITKEDDLLRSNFGKAISLDNMNHDWVKNISKLSDEMVGVVYIADPATNIYQTTIKNHTAKNLENLNFQITSKWFNSKRTCSQVGNDVVVNEEFEIINPILFHEDLKTQEFKELKAKLKQHMQGAILIGEVL